MMRFAITVVTTVLVALLLGACESTEPRQPSVEQELAPEFRQQRVRDVAIIPPTGMQFIAPSGIELPTPEARYMMYIYMIRDRNYASPKPEWVDEKIASGAQTATQFDSDGVLTLDLEQWDASMLGGNGSVYAGGTFKLIDRSGQVLWRYRCTDMRIVVPPPFGTENTLQNLRYAARRFVERCLDNLPASPRLSVDELKGEMQNPPPKP